MNKKSGFYKTELFATFAVFFMTLLLFASCSFINNTYRDKDSSDDEVSVYLSINGIKSVNVRTALPSISLGSYSYTIKAKNQTSGTEEILASGLEISELSNQRFTMKRAKWIFSVLAYLITIDESSGESTVSQEASFEGNSSEIDLEHKSTAVVNMSLKATSNGSGTVIIPVSYTSKGVKKVTCGLYTSPTDGELVEGKTLVTWTLDVENPDNRIQEKSDGTYSVLFTDEEVPSGKTVYARFILYDENDVPVGYYTEAVYVVKDEVSKPVVFIKNEDGSYQKDENGNFVQNTEAESVEVETNLFPATISAEKEKRLYAETVVTGEDGQEHTLTYELYDEDGDGLYDTVLPPGDYTIKVSEINESPEQAQTVEDISLDVGTKGGKSVVAKLVSVKLSSNAEEKYYVGDDVFVEALSNNKKQLPLLSQEFTVSWLISERADGDYQKIENADSVNLTLVNDYADKYLKVKVVQNFNGKLIEKESDAVLVRIKLKAVELSSPVKVALALNASVKNQNDDIVQNDIVYQWYKADSLDENAEWTEITDAVTASYTPLVDDVEKYLLVKVHYRERPEKIISSLPVQVLKGILPENSLSVAFEKVLTVGEQLKDEDIVIRDNDNNQLELGEDYTLDIPEEARIRNVSSNVDVKINVPGYEPYPVTLYIPVKAGIPDANARPALRTDTDEISGNHIAFTLTEENTGKYEYSLDGGESWITLTAEQIPVSEELSSIHIRVSQSGSENEGTYVAASDKIPVQITSQNRGTRPVFTISVTISGDIEITKSENTGTDENLIVFTASSGFSNYEWKIDGLSVSEVNGANVNSNDGKELSVNIANWNVGEYKIGLTAVKNGLKYSSIATVSVTAE